MSSPFRDINEKGDYQQMTVTGPAAQLPTPLAPIKMPERVILQALVANTASVFIKDANDVAIGGTTGGHELPPGSSMILPVVGFAQWWLIANAGSQKIQVTYVAG